MTEAIGSAVQLAGVLGLALTFISKHAASSLSQRTQLWVDGVRASASFKYTQYLVGLVAWYMLAVVGYTGRILGMETPIFGMETPIREAAVQAAVDTLIAFPLLVFGLAILLAGLLFPLSKDDVAAREWWRTQVGWRKIIALFSGLIPGLIGVVWICYLMVLPLAVVGPSLLAIKEIGWYQAVRPLVFSMINFVFMGTFIMISGPGRHLGRRDRFRRALVQVWHFVAPTTGQVIMVPFTSLCKFAGVALEWATSCVQKRTNLVRALGVAAIITGLSLELFASLAS